MLYKMDSNILIKHTFCFILAKSERGFICVIMRFDAHSLRHTWHLDITNFVGSVKFSFTRHMTWCHMYLCLMYLYLNVEGMNNTF